MSEDHPAGRLLDRDELTRSTTIRMMGNLEWTGPIFQSATLFVSSTFDPYAGNGGQIVFYLALAHLLIVPIYVRGYAPLALGGWWVFIYPVQALVLNLVLFLLSEPHTYAHSTLCVPGCNYSAPMWLFFAYYPWPSSRYERRRRPLELTSLVAYFSFFMLLAWIDNDTLQWRYAASAGISLMWLSVAYILGIAINKMCVAAADKQLEIQQQNFTDFFDFLHSHVKAGIAAIRTDMRDPSRIREKLTELENAVSSYRVELLLSHERVPLAALFSERIRTFAGVLTVIETPRVGAVTVSRPVGMMIGRTLGDLLKNSAKYGASTVAITCDVRRDHVTVEVADDGPGLPPGILDDESRSLHRLMLAARSLGGSLTELPSPFTPGSKLSLDLPLYTRR